MKTVNVGVLNKYIVRCNIENRLPVSFIFPEVSWNLDTHKLIKYYCKG